MHNERTEFTSVVLAALALAIAGCGGGGGSAPSSSPPPPSSTDTTAPDTTITSTPVALSNSNSANFNASSNESGSTFEASLDSAAFASISLPLQLSSLADGTHTLAIRARDPAGNIDATPATFTWTVDTNASAATIVFPLPNAYTDAATLTVRGTVAEPSGTTSVHVNDVAATSSDGFKSWSAVVPIHTGENKLVISTSDETGNTNANAASASVFNRGPVIGSFAGLALDTSTNQLLVGDGSLQSLYLFDPVAGSGKTLASYNGESLAAVSALTIDATNHRALIIDGSRDVLVAVDLSTGAAHDLSTTDPSNPFSTPTSLAVDDVHHAVFVGSPNTITQIDLNSGARVVVSGGASSVGSGPALTYSPLIALDTYTTPGTPRLVGAVMVDVVAGSAAIIAVDPVSGVRQIISPSDTNSAPISRPTAVALDPNTHHLLVLDSGTQTLISVDLATGNRTVISDQLNSSESPFAPTGGLAIKGGLAFVVQPHGEVLSLDLATGARQTILHSRVGQGAQLGLLSTAAIEQSGSLLVLEGGRLTRVSLSTGDRAIVSSSDVGTGPFNTGFAAMTLDTRANVATRSALAVMIRSNELVSVDLATGNRAHVADLGLSFPNVQGDLRLDAEANRIYFINIDDAGPAKPALYSYDLGTGQRMTVTASDVGNGLLLRGPKNFVLDKTGNRIIVSDPSAGGWVSVNLQSGGRALLTDDWSAMLGPGPLYFDTPRSRLIGLKWAPIGARTEPALAALQSSGWSIDDAALFTMMMMMESPMPFTDSNGVLWIGGAANYNGTLEQRIAYAERYNLYPRSNKYDYIRSELFSMAMPSRTQTIISGPDLTLSMRGNGPSDISALGIDVDPTAQIAYLPLTDTQAIMAIDLISGDRVLISH